MRILLIVFAVSQIVLGLLLWLAPGFFHEEIGPYGARNDHYMGDLATWYLALGGVLLASLRQVSWRVPVLVLAFAQNTLHAVNHLIDVGEADPSWLGPFNLVSLVLVSILLAWMINRERRAARA
jgi:hypothetical protein